MGWTAPALKNYTDFTNRLEVHKQRLTQLGVNYNPSAVPPQIADVDARADARDLRDADLEHHRQRHRSGRD